MTPVPSLGGEFLSGCFNRNIDHPLVMGVRNPSWRFQRESPPTSARRNSVPRPPKLLCAAQLNELLPREEADAVIDEADAEFAEDCR